MKKSILGLFAGLLVIPPLMVGCGGSGGFFSALVDSVTFQRSGGRYSLLQGLVVFLVPQLAVVQDLRVLVRRLDEDTSDTRRIRGTRINMSVKSGLIEKPIGLTIKYEPEDVPAGIEESKLAVYRKQEGVYTRVAGSTVDAEQNTVTAEVKPSADEAEYVVRVDP
jgi:hypothetical protein